MSAFDEVSTRQARFRYQRSRARRAFSHQRRKTFRDGRPEQCARRRGLSRLAGDEAGHEWPPRLLLGVEEAVELGANPARSFGAARRRAGVRHGDVAGSVEKLAGRSDVAVTELRGMAMQGLVPIEQLSAIAMAKSMVGWHQRHGFCANCGAPHVDEGRRLEARMPELQGRTFSAHRSGRDHAGHARRACLLGRQKQFLPGMYSCLAGFVEAAETIEDAVRREILRGKRTSASPT